MQDVFNGTVGVLTGLLTFVLIVGAYFLPTIIGFVKKKRNAAAILVLNLFAGWTFIGWVVALVWSLTHEAPTVSVPVVTGVPTLPTAPAAAPNPNAIPANA